MDRELPPHGEDCFQEVSSSPQNYIREREYNGKEEEKMDTHKTDTICIIRRGRGRRNSSTKQYLPRRPSSRCCSEMPFRPKVHGFSHPLDGSQPRFSSGSKYAWGVLLLRVGLYFLTWKASEMAVLHRYTPRSNARDSSPTCG